MLMSSFAQFARTGVVTGSLFLFPLWLLAQRFVPVNLVPNPGFEVFTQPPQGWFMSGRDFSKTVDKWSSPTGASPDVYGPGVVVPAGWEEKGFGVEKPRSGQAMAGITVYGCGAGKPHCREYLQVRLNEPLVYGQVYEFSFWVRKLAKAGAIDRLGVAFSYHSVSAVTTTLLPIEPAWECRKLIGSWVERWQKITDTIHATGEERYLLIGNFRPDSLTVFKPTKRDPLPFAYYYIDEVSLVKRPPILVVSVQPDDLALLKPKAGMLVRLQTIHFDTDQSSILPESLEELEKLLKLLRQYPKMAIEIIGHTDTQGTDEYNLALSDRRATTVYHYLIEKGVAADRLSWKGRGARQPAATNNSPEGRRINRRVEFLIQRM